MGSWAANWVAHRHGHITDMFNTLPKIRLATHDGDVVDSENAIQIEMVDALILHGAQT